MIGQPMRLPGHATIGLNGIDPIIASGGRVSRGDEAPAYAPSPVCLGADRASGMGESAGRLHDYPSASRQGSFGSDTDRLRSR
jgi:hypothetical protein